MGKVAEGRGETIRRQARQRLRGTFLRQASEQVREAARLATGEGDAREAAAADLERLAATAGSLGLRDVQGVAENLAADVRGGRVSGGFRALARALRDAGLRSRFPPLLVVAPGPAAARIRLEAERCCEPVRVYESLQAMRDDLLCEAPQALVLPVDLLDALQPEEARVPLFVYGPADDLEARRRAAAAAVAAYLPERASYGLVLHLVRGRSWLELGLEARVLLVIEDETLREELGARLEAHRVSVGGAGAPPALIGLLGDAAPDLVVLQAAPEDATEAIRILRGHFRYGAAGVLAIGEAEAVGSLLDAGADQVLAPDLPLNDLAGRVRSALRRCRWRSEGRDKITGLRTRAEGLRAVDRAMAESRRSGRPLAVAILEVLGLGAVNERSSRSAGDEGLRVLARCVESGVRSHDLVARVGGRHLLVLFPNCNAEQAGRRVAELQQLFTALVAREEALQGLSFQCGLADTEAGVEQLLARAEADLERALRDRG